MIFKIWILSIIFAWLCAGFTSGINSVFFITILIVLQFILTERLLKPRLGKKNTQIILFFISVHLILMLLYLLIEWQPGIQLADKMMGGDAQRYFHELESPNWWSELKGKNYVGIYIYLKFIFLLGGHNVYVPAIANAFLFSYAVSLLTVTFFDESSNISVKRNLLISNAIVYLNPSMICYNTQSGKESIILSVFIITIVIIIKTISHKIKFTNLVMMITSFFVLILLKTWLVLIHLFSILYVVIRKLLATGKCNRKLTIFIGCTIFLIPLGTFFQQLFGGYEQDFKFILDIFSLNRIEDFRMHFNHESSLSYTLIPTTFLEFVLFGFVRSIIYIVIPFPNISIFLNLGDYPITILSVFIGGFINFIMVLKFIMHSAIRVNNQLKLLKAILIFSFISVGFSQLIFVERYRVFYEVLLVFVAVCVKSFKRYGHK